MLEPKPEGLYSGGSTWGDLAWHLSMISNFAERGLGATGENPIFPGTKLSYPFFPDMLSAALVHMGISLQASLIWPTLVALLCALAGMYWFAHGLLKSTFEAMLVPILFFFNGSIVGCYYCWLDLRKSGMSVGSFLNNLPDDYAHLIDRNIHFSNVISDYILPQRAMVFGLALGIVVVHELWRYWERGSKNHLFYAGLLLSLMPLVHFHSFVALAMAAAFLFLLDLEQKPKSWKNFVAAWACFAIPLVLIALPQAFWITPHHTGSFIRWQLGWMKKNDSLAVFWLKNLSPHLFVFTAAFFLVEERFRQFWYAFVAVFFLANLVVFQPHDFDNMKLMLWTFLVSCIGTAALFAKLRRQYSRMGSLLSLFLTAALIATGCLSVYRELRLHSLMFTTEDLQLAEYVREQTPKDAVFLTSDRHNHPIPCLAGRRIVMGYRGWLWTHGIDYHIREQNVLQIYRGLSDVDGLLKQYDVSYILLERNRTTQFPQNELGLRSRFPRVYESQSFVLLKVKQ
jgi:hypothetical protein